MRASTPGNGRAETAAPPAWPADSSTSTRRPEAASRVAATSPLWPAPTMRTSGLGTPPSVPPARVARGIDVLIGGRLAVRLHPVVDLRPPSVEPRDLLVGIGRALGRRHHPHVGPERPAERRVAPQLGGERAEAESRVPG